jgi:hypothetical protein
MSATAFSRELELFLQLFAGQLGQLGFVINAFGLIQAMRDSRVCACTGASEHQPNASQARIWSG